MNVLWTLFVFFGGMWLGWQLWLLINRSVPESDECDEETDTWN